MLTLQTIAHMHSAFPEKFGIPRQSGLVETLSSTIVFVPEFRNPDALRGLEGFSHIWLIWGFSEAANSHWSATVRPPRLGGNARLGVFATRSPFRPNPLGLSCVRVADLTLDGPEGPMITVLGADLMDGSPIYDIKPYIPYADSHPRAQASYAQTPPDSALQVQLPENLCPSIVESDRRALMALLSLDPRPAYQRDPERVYGLAFRHWQVRFRVEGERLVVLSISQENETGADSTGRRR